jgi:hypothetical protein
MDVPTVWLKDDTGRSLFCHLEYSLTLKGETYGLLQPVDAPVMIFAWDDDSDEPTILEEIEDLEPLLPTARAVLSEQNLTLLDTAVTLTVEGDLPELDDDDDLDSDEHYNGSVAPSGLEKSAIRADSLQHSEIERKGLDLSANEFDEEDEDEDDFDEYQLLAHFLHDDREYEVYTPIKPPFAFWTLLKEGEPQLLPPEAIEEIEPLLNEAVARALDLQGEA